MPKSIADGEVDFGVVFSVNDAVVSGCSCLLENAGSLFPEADDEIPDPLYSDCGTELRSGDAFLVSSPGLFGMSGLPCLSLVRAVCCGTPEAGPAPGDLVGVGDPGGLE